MKAKAMKKTLSCILALTLTASMMAESLTAFAVNGGAGAAQVVDAPEEDVAPTLATTPFVLGDTQVITSVKISGPTKYTVYSDDTELDLSDVIVTIAYQDVTGATYNAVGEAETYKLTGETKYWYGSLKLFTRLEGTDLSNLKTGNYTLTAYTTVAGTSNGFVNDEDGLTADGLTAVIPTLYFANNTINTTTGAFEKASEAIDLSTATAASGIGNAAVHAIKNSDASITVVKAVVSKLQASLEEGAIYYKGQSVGDAFKNAKFYAVKNSGKIDTSKALDITGVKWSHDGTNWKDTTSGEDITLADASEDTIIFANKEHYASTTDNTGALKVEVTVLLKDNAVTELAWYDLEKPTKTYKKGQNVLLNAAIIEVTDATGKKDYLVSRNADKTWYLVDEDNDALIAWQACIKNKGDNEAALWTAVETAGAVEVNLADSAAEATTPDLYYIDFDNETVGTGKTATLTYMGKSLVLGTDFAVEDDKVVAVALGVTDDDDQLKAAIDAGRIVDVGVSPVHAYKFYFAPGDDVAFTEGDACYILLYKNGGVSQDYDLATNISKFDIAAGQIVAGAETVNLKYNVTEDIAETAAVNDLTGQLPIKVEERNYTVTADATKANSPVLVAGTEKPDFSGITVTVANASTGTKIVDAKDLAEIAADTTGKWKVTWIDGVNKKIADFTSPAAGTYEEKVKEAVTASKLTAIAPGDIIISYSVNGVYFWTKLTSEDIDTVADYVTEVSVKSGATTTEYYVPSDKLLAVDLDPSGSNNYKYASGAYAATNVKTETLATDIAGAVLQFKTAAGKTDTVTITGVNKSSGAVTLTPDANNSVIKSGGTDGYDTAGVFASTLKGEVPSSFIVGENTYYITYTDPNTKKETELAFTLTGTELAPVSIAASTVTTEGGEIAAADALLTADKDKEATKPVLSFAKGANSGLVTQEQINKGDRDFVVTWNNGLKSFAAKTELKVTDVDTKSVATDKKTTVTFVAGGSAKATTAISEDFTVAVTLGDVNTVTWASFYDKSDGTTKSYTAGDKLYFVVGDTALKPYKVKIAGSEIEVAKGDKLNVTVTYAGGGATDTFDLLDADDLAKFTVKTNIDTSEVATGKDLVLTYGGKDLTLKYDVDKSSKSWTLVAPTKTVYKSGETLDLTGGILKETTTGQNGGTKEISLADIAAGTVTGYAFDQVTTNPITAEKEFSVSYNDTTIDDSKFTVTVADAFVTALTKDGEIDDSKFFRAAKTSTTKPDFGNTKIKYTSTDEDGTFLLNSIRIVMADADGKPTDTPATNSSAGAIVQTGALSTAFYKNTCMTITYVNDDGEIVNDPAFEVAGEHTITVWSFDQKATYTVDVQEIVATDIVFGLADKSVKVTEEGNASKGLYVQEFKQDDTVKVYEGYDVSAIKFANTAAPDGAAPGNILIKYNNGKEVLATVTSGVITAPTAAIQAIPGHGTNTPSFKVTCDMSTAGDAVPATITFKDGDTTIAKTFPVKILEDTISASNVAWSFKDERLPNY